MDYEVWVTPSQRLPTSNLSVGESYLVLRMDGSREGYVLLTLINDKGCIQSYSSKYFRINSYTTSQRRLI